MFTFSKSKRLLNKKQFDSVFKQPKRLSTNCFLMLYSTNQEEDARLGIIVSKKNVSLAVKRNRIRRLIRESFRLNALPSLDIIVLVKNSAVVMNNRAIRLSLEQLWVELVKSASKQ